MKNKTEIPNYIGPDICLNSKMMTKNEIRNRFNNEVADLYSQRKPLWLPEFDYAFNLITKILNPYIKTKTKILDLGAGTGNLSRTVLERYNDVHITLLDFSENMLKEAPNVLLKFTGKYEVIVDDIFDYNFEEFEFNNVISSFAIHHARGEDVYKNLYKKIYRWIKPPGIFICCDVVEGDNHYLSELNEIGWSEYLNKQNFLKQDIKKILSNYHREDSPLSIKNHLKLLVDGGFKSADVIWKKYNFGIYIGVKDT